MYDILPLKPSRSRRRSILHNTRSAHTWQPVNLESSVDPTVVRAAPKKSEDTPRPLSAWELAIQTTGIPSSLWERFLTGSILRNEVVYGFKWKLLSNSFISHKKKIAFHRSLLRRNEMKWNETTCDVCYVPLSFWTDLGWFCDPALVSILRTIPGGTPYNGQYREALLSRRAFCRLQECLSRGQEGCRIQNWKMQRVALCYIWCYLASRENWKRPIRTVLMDKNPLLPWSVSWSSEPPKCVAYGPSNEG